MKDSQAAWTDATLRFVDLPDWAETMADASRSRGASTIETEDFDIRQGFGPERSQETAELLRI